jgi:DNA (cytosine-5)-methyltransferase 1
MRMRKNMASMRRPATAAGEDAALEARTASGDRQERFSFLEFFSGGGMARMGLGAHWRCAFANDADGRKCAAYRENFGGEELIERDIRALGLADLPAFRADLAWASFPCQDLSLAGPRMGLLAVDKESG